MVVTRETYATGSPTTAAEVATQLGDAFIDAGYMTAWFDSYADGGIEYRVLRIIYDAAKTYGTTYYKFAFSGASIYVHISSGWNATTHQPTGTQWADYVSTANAVSNMMLFKTFSTSVTVTVTRWTSGIDSAFSWFLIRNGSTTFNFHISKTAPLAMVDLNKSLYHGLIWYQAITSNRAASCRFRLFPITLRRHHLGQSILRGITDSAGGLSWYGCGTGGEPWGGAFYNIQNILSSHSYHLPGNASVSGDNAAFDQLGLILPTGFNNTNDAYATDSTPIHTGMLLNLYSAAVLPSDFGIAGNYNDNVAEPLDVFVVKTGGVVTSKWDMVDVKNTSGTPAGVAPSIMLLARTE